MVRFIFLGIFFQYINILIYIDIDIMMIICFKNYCNFMCINKFNKFNIN